MDPSPPGEEQENRSSAQRLGDPSETPIGILGSSLEEPDAFLSLNPHLHQHMPSPAIRWPHDLEAVANPTVTPTRAPSPSPSITSVLGKRHTPPPPTSPPPLVGSPITQAPQDWRAWMDWKRALYSQRNPGRSVLGVVTPLDIRDAAATAPPAPSPSLPPPPLLPSPRPPLSHSPPLLPCYRRPLRRARSKRNGRPPPPRRRPRRPTPLSLSAASCPFRGRRLPVFTRPFKIRSNATLK